MPENLYDNESDLLRAAADGEESAFTQLVNLYWNKVYHQALTYAKSTARAEELTQDVFLRVWTKREALREVRDFKAYLFILSRNQIFSALRQKLQPSTALEVDDAAEDVLVPDQQLQFKDLHNTLLRGIAAMPPQRKRVFTLSRLEGKTYEEIAQELGISKGMVKDHIVLALNALRQHLRTTGHTLPLWLVLLLLRGPH